MKKKQNDRIKALCNSESELLTQFSKAQTDFLEFFETNVKSLPREVRKPLDKMEEIDPILKEELAKFHFSELISRAYPRFDGFLEKLDLFILGQEKIPSKIVKIISDLSQLLRLNPVEEIQKLNEREGRLIQIELEMESLWKELKEFEIKFKEIRQEFIHIKGHLHPGSN
jgi:hypothetical protein